MNNRHWLIIKEKNKKAITYFEYTNLNGFNMTSKNKNIKLKDAINVNKMIIINPSLIEKLIDKRINTKLRKLIEFILGIYDESTDPSGTLMLALNEVEKFKREIINKYIAYLNKEQLKNLDKKIKYLEQEVTMKSYYMNEQKIFESEYETTRSR